MNRAADDTTTLDALMGGRVKLRQPAKGYRAGMDAALLAAALDLKPGERAIEAGCGAGAALFQAAARAAGSQFVGVEKDQAALALATENIALNGVENRVDVVWGDVAKRPNGVFDLAFSNPPFFDDAGAIRGPAPARRGAWIADDGLETWTRFLLKAVREGGRIVVIHRADRLADLLALLGDKAGGFQIRPVHPHADEPAKRVIVRAVKTGKAPLQLLPPLVLHDRAGGKHTAEAEAILRGETGLAWR